MHNHYTSIHKVALTSQSFTLCCYPSQSLNLQYEHTSKLKRELRGFRSRNSSEYDLWCCSMCQGNSGKLCRTTCLPPIAILEVRFSTLIFASCQIQSPSAGAVIKDGSDTYQRCHSPYTSAITCAHWHILKCAHVLACAHTQYTRRRVILMFVPHAPCWHQTPVFCLMNSFIWPLFMEDGRIWSPTAPLQDITSTQEGNWLGGTYNC